MDPVLVSLELKRKPFLLSLMHKASMLDLVIQKNDVEKIQSLKQEINLLIEQNTKLRVGSLEEVMENLKLDLSSDKMSQLNQVVVLSIQLHSDVDLKNHKYIAHQIALLYQSLNNSRQELKLFRPLIEKNFEQIKSVCSKSSEPRLSPEQREWIRQITTQILNESLFNKI